MADPKCYVCGRALRLEDGVVAQVHEGLRHPTCDPQTHGPGVPAISETNPYPPEAEELRHIRVRNRWRAFQADAISKNKPADERLIKSALDGAKGGTR